MLLDPDAQARHDERRVKASCAVGGCCGARCGPLGSAVTEVRDPNGSRRLTKGDSKSALRKPPLDEAAEGHRHYESRRTRGKIVLTPCGTDPRPEGPPAHDGDLPAHEGGMEARRSFDATHVEGRCHDGPRRRHGCDRLRGHAGLRLAAARERHRGGWRAGGRWPRAVLAGWVAP